MLKHTNVLLSSFRKIDYIKIFVVLLLLIALPLLMTSFGIKKEVLSGYSSMKSGVKNTVIRESAKSIKPSKLIIPSISVRANIEHVGIEKDGAMSIPAKSVDVGWYKYGSIPRDMGSTVLAGHVRGDNGELGIFANLHKLISGDSVFVLNDDGKSHTYIVRESRIYDPISDTTAVFGQTNGSHLNLITCYGFWNEQQDSYTKRLVVFTNLINN